eukprot:5868766-Amphidinium_carterae.1
MGREPEVLQVYDGDLYDNDLHVTMETFAPEFCYCEPGSAGSAPYECKQCEVGKVVDPKRSTTANKRE